MMKKSKVVEKIKKQIAENDPKVDPKAGLFEAAGIKPGQSFADKWQLSSVRRMK